MLAVCSGWMVPAIRRFGLEILPPADLALERDRFHAARPAAGGIRGGIGWNWGR